MNICKRCGYETDEQFAFCPRCGEAYEVPKQASESSSQETHHNYTDTSQDYTSTSSAETEPPIYNAEVVGESPNSNSNHNGMLIWSIANTALGLVGCCSCLPLASCILGIIAIVFTLNAKSEKTEELENQKIKVARTLNIIASSIVLISVILTVISAILTIFSSGSLHFTTPPIDFDEFMRRYPSLN